jgi:hypothetical protein
LSHFAASAQGAPVSKRIKTALIKSPPDSKVIRLLATGDLKILVLLTVNQQTHKLPS